MAYRELNNGIKKETTHFHDLLHAQLSAEDSRNIDKTDSAEESGESPLDFSIKRKSTSYEEVSGSDSLSSPASSLNDTGGNSEERKTSDTDGVHNKSGSSYAESPPDRSPLFHHKQFKNELFRQNLSPVHEKIGQPRPAEQGLPHMFHELQMGITNANMLANSFPAMAALMESRYSGSPKGTRPFKAYPKDALTAQMERGAQIPHYLTSLSNFENSALIQGLNLSSEEVFSIYKQQLLALREREKYLECLKISQEQSIARTSATISSSTTPSSLPTSISSISLPGRNNGFHNNILGNIPSRPTSSSRSSPPTSEFGSKSPTNGSIDAGKGNRGHSPSIPSLTAGGRRRPRSLPDEQKDEAYWERRRKNNEAAKRSRDARRAKEDQIAIRAALLEQENLKLRVEVAALKTETAKLRCMLYNS